MMMRKNTIPRSCPYEQNPLTPHITAENSEHKSRKLRFFQYRHTTRSFLPYALSSLVKINGSFGIANNRTGLFRRTLEWWKSKENDPWMKSIFVFYSFVFALVATLSP
ncbi:Hypothetical protein CINCED_3A000886 [Cinara cedri]|uniref:Uncharacterized protein n=1 Tax=Cinara cedri TaxID=506608 RepID=A0A5E4N865_9HEMI|nr:Hypothetical protein CINCED_3A000886 [Cinara cedri]